MPKKEDVEFQIELLKIQIQNEITTEFFVAMIAIGVAALLSLGISLTVAGEYNFWVVISQTVVAVIYVMILYTYWNRQGRRMDEQIENVRRRFA